MANEILMERFGDYDFQDNRRDWIQWLTIFAHDMRAAMLAHREGSRIVAGAHLHIAVMLTRLMNLSVRILHNAGFSYSLAATITVTVTNFCFGYVIEEQSGPTPSETPFSGAILPRGEFQALRKAMAAWWDEDESAHFDTAVRMIINGARAEL